MEVSKEWTAKYMIKACYAIWVTNLNNTLGIGVSA